MSGGCDDGENSCVKIDGRGCKRVAYEKLVGVFRCCGKLKKMLR